jgi:hypothetical protein
MPMSLLLAVANLRARVQSYVLPFLSLPVETSRETALEVFINMNTSASPLKDFDIVVAQVEEATGESLHQKITDLLTTIPSAKDYGSIESLLLSVAALLLEKPPLKKTYLEEDFGTGLVKVWPQMSVGLKRGMQFLSEEAIFDEKSLPTEIALYLTCALWAVAADLKLDQEGNARSLIRKVLWRACYTNRYGKTSATRAYADFRSLASSSTRTSTDCRTSQRSRLQDGLAVRIGCHAQFWQRRCVEKPMTLRMGRRSTT